VGFDCYPSLHGGTFDGCGYPNALSMRDYVEALKAKLAPHQRIVLVPEAFHYSTTGTPANAIEEEALLILDRRFIDLALSEPRVVALWPFVGPHFTSGRDDFFGAFEIPSLKDLYDGLAGTMGL